MSQEFSVVAIVSTFNEEDIICQSVSHLIDQGVSVYVLDDGSKDGTVRAIERFVGHGLIGIEQLTRSSRAELGFRWEEILRRKSVLATSLPGDWFIHNDADEFRSSPWPGVTLHEAIRRVDQLGYNAIDSVRLDFWPTITSQSPGENVTSTLTGYSMPAPYDRLQIRCWKKGAEEVDLASSGGHEAVFADRRVFPIRFILRHYPIRSQAHGERKVWRERKPRFLPHERQRGWHIQYDQLKEGDPFVRSPGALTPFDEMDVQINQNLHHREVERLESLVGDLNLQLRASESEHLRLSQQLQDAVARELRQTELTSDLTRRLDAALSDVDTLRRTHDHERELAALLHAEIETLKSRSRADAILLVEAENTRQSLERRISVLGEAAAELHQTLGQFHTRVQAIEASRSWRWMAAARWLYRLMGRASGRRA